MKGLFIPGITAEMFRNGCLESIVALMAEGKIYDIDYSPWIPVSERLPEEEGNYLVTRDGNLGHSIVDIAIWFKSEKANNGFYNANRVSAWCELPTPYEGGTP